MTDEKDEEEPEIPVFTGESTEIDIGQRVIIPSNEQEES